MHRFFLSPAESTGKIPRLSSAESHHALHVLRLRDGERVVVLDGAGRERMCEIKKISEQSVELKVLQESQIPPLPCAITLIQAVTKGKSMDQIIQKATELGVHRIVPILSERSVPHTDEGTDKAEKWKTKAIEAIKQCGSPWLPKIESPTSVTEFLARRESPALSLVASLQPLARHPGDYLRNYAAEHGGGAKNVSIWIGPEGDFTPAEMNAITGSGALPITLGPLILRSETAAIYCVAVLNYELQFSTKR